MGQVMSWRRAAAGVGGVALAAAAAVAGVQAASSGGPRSGVPAEAVPVASPPTTVDQSLVDRQPAPGATSPILPRSQTVPSTPTLVIPALGVTAPILAEGIDRTSGDVGNLAVPSDVREVGWWDGGPAPGQGGTAVLASHRSTAGVFWRLPELRPGDQVQVTGSNGQITQWTITSIQQQLKADLPASVWTVGGTPRLALVTCGGQFNYNIGHYNDNVIVWATLA